MSDLGLRIAFGEAPTSQIVDIACKLFLPKSEIRFHRNRYFPEVLSFHPFDVRIRGRVGSWEGDEMHDAQAAR